MLEDTLKGTGRPMIPSVMELLETLSRGKEAREWMPALTILYIRWTQAMANVHHSFT